MSRFEPVVTAAGTQANPIHAGVAARLRQQFRVFDEDPQSDEAQSVLDDADFLRNPRIVALRLDVAAAVVVAEFRSRLVVAVPGQRGACIVMVTHSSTHSYRSIWCRPKDNVAHSGLFAYSQAADGRAWVVAIVPNRYRAVKFAVGGRHDLTVKAANDVIATTMPTLPSAVFGVTGLHTVRRITP